MEALKTRTSKDVKELLGIYQDLAESYVGRGSKEDLARAGANLAKMVANPENADMANGLVAILEYMRAEYRRLFAPVEKAPIQTPSQKEVNLGTFTVEFPDGDYYTVELEEVKEGDLAGKVIASFLRGPDNENDFQGFAFINQRQGRFEVQTWKRFRGIDERWKMAALIAADADEASRLGMAEAYALRSGRCARCRRKLTVPASLHRGYGPDCAAKIGLI